MKVVKKENRFFILVSVAFIILFSAVILYKRELNKKVEYVKSQLLAYNNRAKLVTLTLKSFDQTNETGKATLKEVNGQVVVDILLENYPKGVSQPLKILLGSCTKLGQEVYSLTNTVNGKSETIIKAGMASLFNGRSMALIVQKSASQNKVIVSCSNLPINY
jgi:hypothetical protein